LQGKSYVDLNRDGYITVDELAQNVQRDIRDYEDNHSIYRKTTNFDGQMIVAVTARTNTPRPEPVEVLYEEQWWKARLMERKGDEARIRWIQLGYDSPDQDKWYPLEKIRPIRLQEANKVIVPLSYCQSDAIRQSPDSPIPLRGNTRSLPDKQPPSALHHIAPGSPLC